MWHWMTSQCSIPMMPQSLLSLWRRHGRHGRQWGTGALWEGQGYKSPCNELTPQSAPEEGGVHIHRNMSG
jgi:ATP-dependent helicase YprA (DUF1998 family)